MKKSAFTLIELLVVIAIIAILAAILFPVFTQAKVAAKKSTSISNLKQQALGVIMYAESSDDAFPLAVMDDGTNNALTYDITWIKFVQPYMKSLDIFVSPGGKSNLSNNDKQPSNRPTDSGPLGPRGGARAQGGPVVSYGVIPRSYWIGTDTAAACTAGGTNCRYQNEYDGKTAFYDGVFGAAANRSGDRCYANATDGFPAPSLTSTAVARPADQITVMESSFWDNGGCYGFVAYPRIRYNFQRAPGFFGDGVLLGKAPVAFADGHVASVDAQRLYSIDVNGTTSTYKYFYPHQ
jgi:prepilin-type N-terminal cleavage/methylation domain-containing protein/prepilin-type processing-associated H-X9-DG protein